MQEWIINKKATKAFILSNTNEQFSRVSPRALRLINARFERSLKQWCWSHPRNSKTFTLD